METLIDLKNLSKSYVSGSVKTGALRNINFNVSSGDFIAITGESGCGKSTLLSIMGLIDDDFEGEYTLKEYDVSKFSFDQRSMIRNKHLGMIFQSFNLIDSLTTFENIALPLKYRGVSANEIKERVELASMQVALSHRLTHRPTQLSGGQQQRVAIARALVTEPDVLLADEATGNLDSKVSGEIMDLICQLNEKGTTVCMVTHEKQYAALAKTKYLLQDGLLSEYKG
jgi:putative ABC transport system ATP-binding protein